MNRSSTVVGTALVDSPVGERDSGSRLSLVSVPALWRCPDVRQFCALVAGGTVADAWPVWQIVTRPRYLAVSVGFGLTYVCVAILLLGPIEELGLTSVTLGPIPLFLAIPVAYVLLVLPIAILAHRASSAWTEGTSTRSVVAQWVAFLSVIVAMGTATPFVVLALWQ